MYVCVGFFSFSGDTHSCRRSPLWDRGAGLSTSSRLRIMFVDITRKNQRCAFSKETQTITDLITPELYRSCCTVFTLSDMAETTAQIRTEGEDSHLNFSWLAAYHKTAKITASDGAWNGPRKADTHTHTHTYADTLVQKTKPASHEIFAGWLSVFVGSRWECFCNT